MSVRDQRMLVAAYLPVLAFTAVLVAAKMSNPRRPRSLELLR
ncbi:hypothetical protein DIQ79_23915 [Mycolicibacterium smegmatis]|uniref:Uncharacterized protein n=1 Tax=Mycolicibacterium smegmatis (strain ATCC 700084 / mc(2)155) TaxID=246196 RepID=A0R0K3_MYCS2|nr:hypothetical protein [Mycolicibacterium smegmatis]ABK74539.1 hypothetical protein MSMEG_4416 [Mycolicibacterium smegmatis MC2 155]TBH33179.1 hypothetical protein EYS45_22625 [Mycolicibacterium smegmatis MC2 155]TBM40417.1 hypothetical protein DIQ86_25985 [Mycolicibacterium smegmatis]TBM48517.1 hypothetical protein DIQ85_23925 [Mycolicibacterium smegmatis]TBM58200.1 hypothetical protein DIQ83_23330 [Mycolicibacterium smegmatis]